MILTGHTKTSLSKQSCISILRRHCYASHPLHPVSSSTPLHSALRSVGFSIRNEGLNDLCHDTKGRTLPALALLGCVGPLVVNGHRLVGAGGDVSPRV